MFILCLDFQLKWPQLVPILQSIVHVDRNESLLLCRLRRLGFHLALHQLWCIVLTTSRLPKMLDLSANPTGLLIIAHIFITGFMLWYKVHHFFQSPFAVSTKKHKYLFVNSLWPPQKINKTFECSLTWLSVSRINFVLIFSLRRCVALIMQDDRQFTKTAPWMSDLSVHVYK